MLTGWGGGIIGILGAYVGYRVGSFESKAPSDGADTISRDKEE